jgi:hypothetical protein
MNKCPCGKEHKEKIEPYEKVLLRILGTDEVAYMKDIYTINYQSRLDKIVELQRDENGSLV